MDKVKVGILGLGRWGTCHLETFSSLDEAQVVAICDKSTDRLEQAGLAYRGARLYSDADEFIQQEDIDLVSVVTFEDQHLDPTLKALLAGKHVLVEKPITTRPQEAKKMLAAAEASGKLLLPGHLLRFDPRYAAIKKATETELVGKPVSMFLKRARERYLYDTFNRTHTVYELMIHDIDLSIWYAGCQVRKVKAYGRTLTGSETPEILWANLEFENGALAVLHSNWLTPDAAGIEIADAIEVIGQYGTANFETSQTGLQIWNNHGRFTPDMNIHVKLHNNTVGSLKEQLSYICRSILKGENPGVISFADAVHGIEVADAIINSCKTDQEIIL